MERGQIIRLVVLVVLVIAVSIAVAVALNYKEYSPLPYSENAAKMGEIDAWLTEQQIAHKANADGQILVPEDQVAQVTWRLASDGIFDDSFNYDWLAMGTGFSSTENIQSAYQTVQTQENLRTMIRGFDKIYDANVLLNVEKEPLYIYSRNEARSSASVQIFLKDPENPLTPAEAVAVRGLVKMAGNFADEDIVLVDNAFNYYDETTTALIDAEIPLTDRLAMQQAIQDELSKSMRKFFEPVFGVGSVEVRVAATLNFDEVTEQVIEFSPVVEGMETGIPIAWKELYETVGSGADVAQGEPGLDENGGAPSYVEDTALGTDSVYEKISKEVNAEINETKRMIEYAQGVVTDLSISVILPLDEEGEDYTEQVKGLAAGAAGVDPRYVTVERLPFQDTLSEAATLYSQVSEQAEQYQLYRLLIIIGAIILVVVLLLLALRTVLKALRPEPEIVHAEAEPNEYAVDLAVGDEGEHGGQEPVPETPLTQIQHFIDKDPESVAMLLRNWLTDDYR